MFKIEDIKTAEMLEQERFEAECESVRQKRNRLLAEVDWTQLPDNPLYQDTNMLAYRKELRDVTEQEGFPFHVIWPEIKDEKEV